MKRGKKGGEIGATFSRRAKKPPSRGEGKVRRSFVGFACHDMCATAKRALFFFSFAKILTAVDVTEEPQTVTLHVGPDRRAARVPVHVDDRDLVRRHCKRTETSIYLSSSNIHERASPLVASPPPSLHRDAVATRLAYSGCPGCDARRRVGARHVTERSDNTKLVLERSCLRYR